MPKNLVGWFLPKTLEARAVWFNPVRYRWQPERSSNSSLFFRCPATHNFSRNLFTLLCPFDIHLKCQISDEGCELSLGEKSSITADKLASLIKVHAKDEWREHDKPLIQIMLNYYFLSDDDIDIQYLSPLTTNFYRPSLPGIVLQGRWNIKSWIRPVNFVFEWWDTSSDLIIKRGQPILNVMFHAKELDARVEFVEAQETQEVIEMARGVQSISSYIKNVFSVFPSISKRRPKRLVKPCKTQLK